MINFVVALPAEATPLVQHWRLKKSNQSHPFPLFGSDTIRLVISGIGKCNSAAATAWLASIRSDRKQLNSVWINLGIAGHSSEALGTAICASRIMDSATQQNWYPTLINNTMKKSTVQTVDRAATHYNHENTLDMEASGFYPTALRISTTELTQCYKVVSDNSEYPMSGITPESTKKLIGDNLPMLVRQVNILQTLSLDSEVIDSSEVESDFYRHWKFSATQKNQLQRLLQRQVAIFGNYAHTRQFLLNVTDKNLSTSETLKKLSLLTNQSAPVSISDDNC